QAADQERGESIFHIMLSRKVPVIGARHSRGAAPGKTNDEFVSFPVSPGLKPPVTAKAQELTRPGGRHAGRLPVIRVVHRPVGGSLELEYSGLGFPVRLQG